MLSARKRNLIEVLLHIAFWVGVYYTLSSLTSSNIHMQLKTRTMAMDQREQHITSPYTFLSFGFLVLLFYGNIFWVFRKALRYKNGFARLAIGIAWFLVIFAANYVIVGRFFNHTNANITDRPIVDSFRTIIIKPDVAPPGGRSERIDDVKFMVNTWQHLQLIMLLTFLAILGISIAYFFLKEWAKSEFIQTQLQAAQLSTEVKFLKSQINPHFLFNTLNNLFSMAQGKGNDELADGISKLSEMMRYMLYESNVEHVSLKKEIEYLENSITLSKLRYADEEVNVKFSYPEDTADIFIAPMIYIPFVENAFKHGILVGQSSPINIAISIVGGQLVFLCENEDYGFVKKMENASGIGLENAKRRLELVYPGRHELMIKKDANKYVVTLKIDLA